MLKKSLIFYIISGIFLFLFFTFNDNEKYLLIDTFNFIVLIIYSIILFLACWSNLFTIKFNLFFILAIYSALYILALNLLSNNYTGDYFGFDINDPFYYDEIAKLIVYNPDNITKFKESIPFDDWGAIALVSSVYIFNSSNLALNLFFWIISIISAKYFYKLSLNFMPSFYSNMATMTFFLSSYYIWFSASGRKETFMVFLIIIIYSKYYEYLKKRKFHLLIVIGICLILLLFFRPAVSLMIIASILISRFLILKKISYKVFLTILAVIISISTSLLLEELAYKFLYINRDGSFLEEKTNTGMIKINLFITYLVNFISGFIGPYPTFSTKSLTYQSIFASGIYLKNILSFSFVIGIFYVFNDKILKLYPIIIFPLLEIISLIAIIETLELRKSLPHFPMVYIVIFWFLYYFNNKVNWKKKTRNRIWNLWYVYIFLFTIFLIIWNLRFNFIEN